jgi:hypothetical protein
MVELIKTLSLRIERHGGKVLLIKRSYYQGCEFQFR